MCVRIVVFCMIVCVNVCVHVLSSYTNMQNHSDAALTQASTAGKGSGGGGWTPAKTVV